MSAGPLCRNFVGALAIVVVLGACSSSGDLAEIPEPIGDFKLGHVVAFADNAQSTPASRPVGADEIEAAIKAAVKERMGRYSGSKFYHISVRVDAYQLGIPGVPVIASPRSGLVIQVGLWDDATATQLNEDLHTLAVLEPTSGATIFGSGYVRSKEEQLEAIAIKSAELIEHWLKSDESPLAEADPVAGQPPAETGAPEAPSVPESDADDSELELPEDRA